MTPRDRRALVAGAGMAAAAFLGLRVVPWAVRDLQGRRERLAARRELLIRTREQIRDAQALADSAPAIERRLVALAPAVLTGRRGADAVTDLLGRLSRAAADQRVRLVHSGAAADTVRVGRLARVTVQASLEGDARGVLGVLAGLERGPAAAVVADVRFTALDPLSPPTAAEVIATDVVIRGWFVVAEPSSGAAE